MVDRPPHPVPLPWGEGAGVSAAHSGTSCRRRLRRPRGAAKGPGMRYGVIASNPLEWLASKVGQIPLPVLDTLLPIVQARALMAAGRCGVLRALAAGPRPVEPLAHELGLDREALWLVLRLL